MDSTVKDEAQETGPKSSRHNIAAESAGADQKSAPTFATSMIVEPAKVIGWLGASVGGLTILVLLVGFLALSAHDAMLGIPRTIEDKSEYIVIGSLFFSRSIMLLLGSLLDNWMSWALLGGLLAIAALLHWTKNRRIAPHLVRLSVVGLIGAQLFALWRLIAPLQFENVLLPSSPASNSQILKWISCDNWMALQSEYGFLVLLVLALALILRRFEYRFQHAEISGRGLFSWRRVRFLSLGLMLICLVLLPRAYGVMTLSNSYPVINLIGKDSTVIPGQVFLLREGDKFMVTYDQAARLVASRKLDSFERIEISGYKHALICQQ